MNGELSTLLTIFVGNSKATALESNRAIAPSQMIERYIVGCQLETRSECSTILDERDAEKLVFVFARTPGS